MQMELGTGVVVQGLQEGGVSVTAAVLINSARSVILATVATSALSKLFQFSF